MTLNWEALQHYKAIGSKAEDISGVYVWGFKDGKKFVPYYAGKAQYVYWRLTDHISAILGGNYSLFDKDHLLDFKNNQSFYNAQNLEKKIEFITTKRHERKADIEFMIDNFHFTCAPVEDFKNDGAEVEKAVLNAFNGKLINTRYGICDKNICTKSLITLVEKGF